VKNININHPKLIVIGAIAFVLVLVLIFSPDNTAWVAPLLTLLGGYLFGNTSFATDRPVLAINERKQND